MPLVNARSAAQLTGRDRSTILRAIESGKLSAVRDEHGHFQIDPAELERVYGTLRSPASADAEAAADAMPQHAYAAELAAQAKEIEFLRRENELLRHSQEREHQAWAEELTFLRGMLERQTEQVKLLTDERQQKERYSPTLWARLWRRQ
jgi:hypothetical protein